MHCCGAARSRIPICLLRNHPSGDPRLLCCSRLMVVPSLMIEGSSSSSSCLVAQNTPVCPRNCVVLHPKHSHRWPRRSRRYPRLPSFCRNVGRVGRELQDAVAERQHQEALKRFKRIMATAVPGALLIPYSNSSNADSKRRSARNSVRASRPQSTSAVAVHG